MVPLFNFLNFSVLFARHPAKELCEEALLYKGAMNRAPTAPSSVLFVIVALARAR